MSGVVTASLLPDRPQRRRHDEDDLQMAVVEFLRWSLPHDAVWYAVPNGGKRHKREAQRMVSLGVRAGVPDLAIVHRGQPLFIELKAKGGTLSASQQQMIWRLQDAGAVVLLCRSLPEVEQGLREAGVALHGRVQA